MGDSVNLPTLLGIALIGGSIGGIIGNWIVGSLIRWTGSWMDGSATVDECRAALAWGSLPSGVILITMLGLVAVFGRDLFRANGLENVGMEKAILLLAVGLAQVVFGLWMVVLNLKAVGEVHRFSAWKALGAFLLAAIVMFAFILLLVLGWCPQVVE